MPLQFNQAGTGHQADENAVHSKNVGKANVGRPALLQRLANQPQGNQRETCNDMENVPTLSDCGENRAPAIRSNEGKLDVKAKTIGRHGLSYKNGEVVLVSKSAEYLAQELHVMELPDDIPDIDEDDTDHLEFCPGLVKYVYAYLYRLETTQLVSPGCLSRHKELRPTMRCILIDWLVAVQQRFKLLQETLFISVAYLDRFLSDTQYEVTRSKLQLVGVACMLLACKYEEMYLPSVADFVYMCDNAYLRDEILRMERMVLCALKFELGRPICSHFLRRYSKAASADSNCHTIAKYLMEVSLYDYELASAKPSVVAAACLLIAGKVSGCIEWDKIVQFYSQYTEQDLKDTASKIARLAAGIKENKHLRATFKKYSHERFSRVAEVCLNSNAVGSFFAPKAM